MDAKIDKLIKKLNALDAYDDAACKFLITTVDAIDAIEKKDLDQEEKVAACKAAIAEFREEIKKTEAFEEDSESSESEEEVVVNTRPRPIPSIIFVPNRKRRKVDTKMAPASDANERAITSASKEDEKCWDHHQSKIILTGFGPFGGVDKNPSTTLVNTFQEYLQNSPDQWKQHLATRIEQCLVLETSANSVRQTLDELAIQKFNATAPPPPTATTPTKTKTTKTTIMLHLGVNYRGTGFQLEQCAYNDATFRIPDQQGYQPQNIAVVPDSKVGTRFDTTLNVQSLVDKMSLKYPQIETKLSTDPGRFLCNYLYCYSLKKFQSSPLSQQEEQELPYQNHNVECLFLHIPHFAVVSEESQLDYCAELMRQLLEICNSGGESTVVPSTTTKPKSNGKYLSKKTNHIEACELVEQYLSKATLSILDQKLDMVDRYSEMMLDETVLNKMSPPSKELYVNELRKKRKRLLLQIAEYNSST